MDDKGNQFSDVNNSEECRLTTSQNSSLLPCVLRATGQDR